MATASQAFMSFMLPPAPTRVTTYLNLAFSTLFKRLLLVSKHKQHTNFCTALYALPMPDVNKMEAVRKIPAKKWNVDIVARENLNVYYRHT